MGRAYTSTGVEISVGTQGTMTLGAAGLTANNLGVSTAGTVFDLLRDNYGAWLTFGTTAGTGVDPIHLLQIQSEGDNLLTGGGCFFRLSEFGSITIGMDSNTVLKVVQWTGTQPIIAKLDYNGNLQLKGTIGTGVSF